MPKLPKSVGRSRAQESTKKKPAAGQKRNGKAAGKVEIIWGPLRHGAGHNVVFYFRYYTGHIVEYSAEEEIILNDANYVPLAWPITDPKAAAPGTKMTVAGMKDPKDRTDLIAYLMVHTGYKP